MTDPLDSFPHLDREVEILVCDASLARALFEGVPAARLLARVQLHRAEHDAESWDELVDRLLPGNQDRVLRAIARNQRTAQDEGPLAAADAVVALLILAASASADASLGEIFASGMAGRPIASDDPELARACARYEPRTLLGPNAIRTAAFECCLRLATHRTAGPWQQRRLLRAARAFAERLGQFLATAPETRLFPHDVDGTQARVVLLDRAPLEALATRDPRELAKVVSALERDDGSIGGLDSLLADLLRLLEAQGDILLGAPLLDPALDAAVPSVRPSDGPVSANPLDWSQPEVAASLANAYENDALTYARLRQLVARGGEPALDAIGAEMLRMPAHPNASTAFAELLAKSGRPRDVMRLVTYFAVTPDPLSAARALGECDAPELPAVLRAWLEAMLPPPGEAVPRGDDPGTSSAARIAACVSSLEPYPHLYGAVRPLLSRVSEAPAPPSG
jgi:hypothetical protein